MLGVLILARAEQRAGRATDEGEPFTRARAAAMPIADALPSGSDTARTMRLVVVAQRHDCEGNLAFAAFFNRARLRERVGVRQLLIEGAPDDTIGLRARLPLLLQRVPLALLRETERSALRAMGHHATPVFLLFDAERRLLAAIPVDPDPVHRTAFLRAITHLAIYDPRS